MNYFMLYSLENQENPEDGIIYVDWNVVRIHPENEIPAALLNRVISTVMKNQETKQSEQKFADNLKEVYLSNNNSEKNWKRILQMKSTGFHSFNATASDEIGIFRADLFDSRIEACKELVYNISQLPDTSVIVVFHNEAWSTLLRTVHSILERSPAPLIREIILVDDASTHEYLKEPLSDYVDHLRKVTDNLESCLWSINVVSEPSDTMLLKCISVHKGLVTLLVFWVSGSPDKVASEERPN